MASVFRVIAHHWYSTCMQETAMIPRRFYIQGTWRLMALQRIDLLYFYTTPAMHRTPLVEHDIVLFRSVSHCYSPIIVPSLNDSPSVICQV